MNNSVVVVPLSFSSAGPDEKLRLGKTLGKVIKIADRVLPIASTFVPALVPVNTAVQAGKQIAGALRH
jgi:hypothetical protein